MIKQFTTHCTENEGHLFNYILSCDTVNEEESKQHSVYQTFLLIRRIYVFIDICIYIYIYIYTCIYVYIYIYIDI